MKHPLLFRAGAFLAACAGLVSTAHSQFYTAPHGPGGTWNLYEVTNATATWKNAHLAAIGRTAGATGVTGVTGNTQTGHLIAINSWQENSLASMIALRHTNSSNVWIGLTDSEDADLGGAGWVDAGNSPTSGQWFWAGTTGGTGPGTALRLTDTGYNAFFTGEPNNAGAAPGEDAVELRTDGKWNDNAHSVAGTSRRYIIEWDINSPIPVAGATVISPLYTAPYGAGGTWNLYMMVAEAETWINAHTRAIGLEAQGTGLLSMAGNTTKGHLLQVNSRRENSFGVAMANRLLTNNNLIGGNTATTNTWLGLTDSEDAGLGAVESGPGTPGLRESNWLWAGTMGGAGANGFQRIEDVLEVTEDPGDSEIVQYWANSATAAANEPNDSGGTNWPFGEDAVELRGDGRWGDLPHKIGPANNPASTIVRRYIIEWDINAAGPIIGAESHGFFYTARHGAGNTWNLYYLDYTNDTFRSSANRAADTVLGTAAATKIPALAGNNTQGHLVEISDAYEHGAAHRIANFATTWIGLTDSEDFGGMESGNAANNPTNQIQPFWVWAGTTSTSTYRRWNAGEPNDSGSNEDAAEMTATGLFNDLQIQNPTAALRRSLLEWDVQSATPIAGVEQLQPLLSGTRSLSNAPAVGTWAVKTLGGVPATGFAPALAGSLDGPTNAVVTEGTFPVINFNDRNTVAPNINFPGWGDPGLFGSDISFPGDTQNVDDNNYIIIARTQLTVTQAGDYTFNIHADDNLALRIAGQTFIRAFGSGHIDTNKDTIFVGIGSGDINLRGSITLAAGTYDLEVIGYEGTGGSSFEVSWSPGIHATDESEGANWTLVGNPSAQYATPLLPASIPGAPVPGNGVWAIHTVQGAGTLASLTDALAALGNPAGIHLTASAPVINHSDPSFAGTGGMFPGEFTLPSDTLNSDDNDFAMHATARIVITNPGIYTFCMKHSETVALRIRGQRFLNVGGEFGIDPADSSTVFTVRNSLNNVNTTEFTSRASINLAAGTYDVEVIAFDRDGAFFVELYSRTNTGNFINTGEYIASGTANAGLATTSGDYRLVGYRRPSDETFGIPGVEEPGWTRGGTTPVAAAPAGWGGTNVANHDLWYDNPTNGATTDPNPLNVINERDPQSPTTDAGIPNGRNFWRNTTADDNHYVEVFTANLIIPEAGTYSFGWQGDDGGYLEIQNLPTGIGFERIEAAAVPGANLTITAATGGFANGRLQNQIGGGNTKSMARITFPNDGSITYPATYPIRSQHFEGTGGSYWEIFAGVSTSYGRPLLLLQSGVATDQGPDLDGILLATVPEVIPVTNVALVDGKLSFTFESTAGTNYSIERSTILSNDPWEFVGNVLAAGATTTFTQPTATLPGEPRYFYRARRVN